MRYLPVGEIITSDNTAEILEALLFESNSLDNVPTEVATLVAMEYDPKERDQNDNIRWLDKLYGSLGLSCPPLCYLDGHASNVNRVGVWLCVKWQEVAARLHIPVFQTLRDSFVVEKGPYIIYHRKKLQYWDEEEPGHWTLLYEVEGV